MGQIVSRRTYINIRQGDLASFAGDVIKRTKDAPDYGFIKPELEELIAAHDHYVLALQDARNMGRVEVAAKNLAMKALKAALDKFADALDANDQDGMLIMNAGFVFQQPSAARSSGILSPPIVTRISGTGRRGEVRIQLANEDPRVVVTHVYAFSEDKGASWKDSEYNSRTNFAVEGLPHSPELMFRFKSIGRGSSKSVWSEPVTVAVP